MAEQLVVHDGFLCGLSYAVASGANPVRYGHYKLTGTDEPDLKWVTGVTWDYIKADKPSGLTTPIQVDLNEVYINDVLKGGQYFGKFFVVCDTEEEAKVAFKKLVEWLYEKRTDVLEQQAEDFKNGRGDFIQRQFKKVGG